MLLDAFVYSESLDFTDERNSTNTPLFYTHSTQNSPRPLEVMLKLKLIYDGQSVGQSVLVSGTHSWPGTNFSFSLRNGLKYPESGQGYTIT
jgi:hypothetical protein